MFQIEGVHRNSLENAKASPTMPLGWRAVDYYSSNSNAVVGPLHLAGDILAVDDTIWVEHRDDLEHEVFPQELCHRVTAD